MVTADHLLSLFVKGCVMPTLPTLNTRLIMRAPAGLVCLELYKVLQTKKLEAFRNTFANLAVPLFAMSEPLPPKAFSYEGPSGAMNWTLWDRWTLEGDLTVQQVLDWFQVGPCSTVSLGTCNPAHKEPRHSSMAYMWSERMLWDRWTLEGDLIVQQVLDWFQVGRRTIMSQGTCTPAHKELRRDSTAYVWSGDAVVGRVYPGGSLTVQQLLGVRPSLQSGTGLPSSKGICSLLHVLACLRAFQQLPAGRPLPFMPQQGTA